MPLTADTGTIENQLTFSKSQGLHRAARRDLPGAARDEEVEEEQEGAAGHFRRRRQQQPLHRSRSAQRGAGKRRLIYAIGVFGGGTTPEEAGGPGLLSHIAEQTGGRLFEANAGGTARHRQENRHRAAQSLRDRISPANQTHDGKYRHITVEVVPPRGLPKLPAHWRLGYYAPVEWGALRGELAHKGRKDSLHEIDRGPGGGVGIAIANRHHDLDQ